MHIYRSDRLYVYQRKHSWGGEGARWCITTFFTGFCEKKTEAGRDVFYGEAYTKLHHKRRSRRLTATAFRSSDSKLNSDSFWSSRSIWSTVWCTAWKVSTSSSSCTRTKCSTAAEMSSASWCAVWRNGHHGTVLLLHCFLLLPYHHVLHSRCLQRPAPHVEGVVQARKKKVLVHGLLQRAPRLVGSSSWYSHLFVYGSMNCSETVSKSMSVCPQRR